MYVVAEVLVTVSLLSAPLERRLRWEVVFWGRCLESRAAVERPICLKKSCCLERGVGLNEGRAGGLRRRWAGLMGAGGRRPVKGDFPPVLAVAGGRKNAGMAELDVGWSGGKDDVERGTVGFCVRRSSCDGWCGSGSQSMESVSSSWEMMSVSDSGGVGGPAGDVGLGRVRREPRLLMSNGRVGVWRRLATGCPDNCWALISRGY